MGLLGHWVIGFVEFVGFIEFIGLLGLLGLPGVPWHPLTRIGATGRSEWPHHVCESHFHCYTEVINFHRPKCFVPY